jgi:DNA invertase Pin-like site-specific DNA recombinase
MAWSVDRLGRSLQDLVGFLSELHALKIDLYLHQQGLDTTTPAGKAMFQMMGVFAEFERAIIQERVRAGLARAKSEGKRLGRPRIAARWGRHGPSAVGVRLKEATAAEVRAAVERATSAHVTAHFGLRQPRLLARPCLGFATPTPHANSNDGQAAPRPTREYLKRELRLAKQWQRDLQQMDNGIRE